MTDTTVRQIIEVLMPNFGKTCHGSIINWQVYKRQAENVPVFYTVPLCMQSGSKQVSFIYDSQLAWPKFVDHKPVNLAGFVLWLLQMPALAVWQ